jgi:23S rRNA (uracil1939-C5)-methyltransferase
LAARVEESLHRLPEPDAIVANPPRGGLHPNVVRRLEPWARERAGRFVYVSCDPATLARDVSRMPAFRMRSLAAYDLFPQTSHVETLAVLEAA